MKPPIFPPQSGGTEAQQLLNRGMQFRDAARPLAGYVNGQLNWPRVALITHAVELALKAYVSHVVGSGQQPAPTKGPANHDLEAWYRLAVIFGLAGDARLAEGIAALNDIHQPHFARYPQPATVQVRGIEIIPDQVVEHLIETLMPVIFPR